MLLAVELIAAVVLLTARLPDRATSTTQRPSAAMAPLIVGDGRTVELINLGGPAAAALLDRIAAGIGAAVDAVETFWGRDWPHRIVVTATGSDRQFAAEAGGGSVAQWSDIAAIAVADRVDPDRRVALGQRIVFAPGAAGMSTAALQIVLTHELFHYASRAETATDAPRWLTEGVADAVARPNPTPDDRPGTVLTLPSDADLDAAGLDRAQAYDRAWWFGRFVSTRYGAPALRELYRSACGPGHTDVPTAVHHALGASLPVVLAEWQRWSPDSG